MKDSDVLQGVIKYLEKLDSDTLFEYSGKLAKNIDKLVHIRYTLSIQENQVDRLANKYKLVKEKL